MKKFAALLLAFTLVFLCSCGSAETNETTETTETTTLPEVTTVDTLGLNEEEPAKMIAVYFSYNDTVGAAADYISEITGCDVFRLETAIEYPENEADFIKQVHEERLKNIRPIMTVRPDNIFDYDIIFLCFPAWDKTIPMIFYTLIEDYDLRHKAIIPVCEGTGTELLNAIRDLNTLKPGMMITDGFSYSKDFLSIADDFSTYINTVLYG